MSKMKWEVSGKGFERTWIYEGVKGTYTLHTQLFGGSNIYLLKLMNDKPYCIRFPIYSSLDNAKKGVKKHES